MILASRNMILNRISNIKGLKCLGVLLLGLCLILVLPNILMAQDDDDLFGNSETPASAETLDPLTPSSSTSETSSDLPDEAAKSNDESQKSGDNYLVWMMKSLGWFFTPVFILLSITMVALIVMNILSIRKSSLVPDELIVKFGELLDDKKYQEAYQLANDDDSLLGKVLATGLSRIPNGYEKAVQSMQDIGQEETMRLENQLGYLSLIGNLAPMIGLFGTVVGMIAAFQVIAAGGAAPSPQKLAEGIATALFTTEVGLAIALPSLAVYDIFRNRLRRFILEIGIVSDNFMGRFSSVAEPTKK